VKKKAAKEKAAAKAKELAVFRDMVRETVEEAVVPLSAQVDKLSETMDKLSETLGTVTLLLSGREFGTRANGHRVSDEA
jgi:hypothetical protein